MHNSSVKWGHLENLDPNSANTILSTNPMGSSSPLWTKLNKHNFLYQSYGGHLAHFEPDSIFHNYYNLNCELVP